MKRWGITALAVMVASAGITTWIINRPAGDDATDREAAQIAERISYPVPDDAAGYARSALYQQDPRHFAVLEVTELPNEQRLPDQPRARLVFRIHNEAVEAGFTRQEAVTACYQAEFNHYGVIGGRPDRVHCPGDATPITPQPVPRKEIPAGYDEAFRTILGELPATPTKDDVLAALRAKLPPPPVDEDTRLAGIPPTLDATVQDGEIGIAARSKSSGHVQCLLGVRANDGKIAAWHPDRETVQPGESTCDGETALLFYRTPPK